MEMKWGRMEMKWDENEEMRCMDASGEGRMKEEG